MLAVVVGSDLGRPTRRCVPGGVTSARQNRRAGRGEIYGARGGLAPSHSWTDAREAPIRESEGSPRWPPHGSITQCTGKVMDSHRVDNCHGPPAVRPSWGITVFMTAIGYPPRKVGPAYPRDHRESDMQRAVVQAGSPALASTSQLAGTSGVSHAPAAAAVRWEPAERTSVGRLARMHGSH